MKSDNPLMIVPVPDPAPKIEAEVAAVELIKINIEELKPNSVIVVKILPMGMAQRMAATQQIALALRPLSPKIKEKNIAFIVMTTDENMEVVEEDQMNAIGWERKEKSRIITKF
jgi:hypothetical protein